MRPYRRRFRAWSSRPSGPAFEKKQSGGGWTLSRQITLHRAS